MMGRQARASVRVMRLWKPHDPGRSCLPLTIRHHVANETDSQNDGALVLDMVELGFRFAATLRQLVQPGPRPVTVRRPYLLMPWHEILGRAGR